MKALKISSFIILALLILKFWAMLDAIVSFFPIIRIGYVIPACIFGVVEFGINIALCRKVSDNKKWKIYTLITTLFSALVILLELLLLYVFSRI